MFKNKAERNRNDEKNNQTGLTVKIHGNHDSVRATAIISEVHRGSEARLRNYIGRPSSEKIIACSDSLSDAFSGMPHQSLQPSFTSRVSPFTSFVL